jgi:hypothetical protein
MIGYIRRQLSAKTLIALIAATAAIAAFLTAAFGGDANQLATIGKACCIGLTLVGFGVIVTGPLFSLSASGQLGKSLVYSEWNGRKYVREYVVPHNPKSLAQQFQRAILGALSRWWGVASDADHLTWQDMADQNEYSTFNAYTSTNLDAEAFGDVLYTREDHTGEDVGTDSPTAPTGVPGVNTLLINCTNGDDISGNSLLMISLGTAGGAAGTAHTIQRTIFGTPAISLANVSVPITNIPAGAYRISARYMGNNGTTTAWVDSPAAYTVTGL